MHRRAFTLSLAALLAACGKPETKAPVSAVPTADPPLAPVTDALGLREALDQARLSVGMPALAGAIVRPDGEIIAATGLREARGQASVTLDDPWRIGTNTQAMTAVLCARLVEAGKLQWDATLSQLFPELKLDPAWTSATIDQLLSHTAGLADVDVAWLIARRADKRPLPEQRLESAREVLAKPPMGKAGVFAYSNLGYVIVGAAIERTVRKSWEDALAEHVFKPLSMTHAAFGANAGDAPLGHRSDSTGRLIPVPPGSDLDPPPALTPSEGVNLPLGDWAKFIRVFIDPKQRFLSAGGLKHLATPAPSTEWAQSSALGWRVASLMGLGSVLKHQSANSLWCCNALLAPEHGVAVLLATNCATRGAQDAIGRLSESLLHASLPA